MPLPFLDYAPRPPRRRLLTRRLFTHRRIRVALLVLLFLAYVSLAVLRPSGVWTRRACTDCGLLKTTHARYLPFTSVSYYTSRYYFSTRIEDILTKHRLRLSHAHQFAVISADYYGSARVEPVSPPGATLIPLDGRRGPDLQALLNNSDFTTFLHNLIHFEDPQTADAWITLILNPDTAPIVYEGVLLSYFPSSGFPTQASFHAWFTSHQSTLLNSLPAHLVPTFQAAPASQPAAPPHPGATPATQSRPSSSS